jgi:hypothetical protein
MRIKMIRTRNFVDPALPGRQRTTQFIAGRIYPEVKRAWGDEMVARGEAIELRGQTRPETRRAPKRAP